MEKCLLDFAVSKRYWYRQCICLHEQNPASWITRLRSRFVLRNGLLHSERRMRQNIVFMHRDSEACAWKCKWNILKYVHFVNKMDDGWLTAARMSFSGIMDAF